MSEFDNKLKKIDLMYTQSQLHVAYAELLRHKADYKYMHAAIQVLFDDVLKEYSKYQEFYTPKEFDDIKEKLLDGVLGFVDQDCDIACKIINKIDEKQAYYGDMIDLYALLNNDYVNYTIMPKQSEFRITEEESNDVMFNYGLTKLNLRFVNVITPRTKYYKLFGDIESVNKARLAIGKPALTFDTIGEEEKATIRRADGFIRLFEILTYKHPDKKEADLIKNIEQAEDYLQHTTEQDVLDNTEFEVVAVEEPQDKETDNEVSDTSKETNDDSFEDEQTEESRLSDELNDEDANAYLPIQEHMEDIYIFSSILSKKREELGIEDEITVAILDISNAILSVFDDELAVPFDELDGIQNYKKDQEEDIEYYLNDLIYRADLQQSIIEFFNDICDPMLTFELERHPRYMA